MIINESIPSLTRTNYEDSPFVHVKNVGVKCKQGEELDNDPCGLQILLQYFLTFFVSKVACVISHTHYVLYHLKNE